MNNQGVSPEVVKWLKEKLKIWGKGKPAAANAAPAAAKARKAPKAQKAPGVDAAANAAPANAAPANAAPANAAPANAAPEQKLGRNGKPLLSPEEKLAKRRADYAARKAAKTGQAPVAEQRRKMRFLENEIAKYERMIAERKTR